MVETVANSEQNVLWTIDEILAATGGSLENSSVSDDVRGISMDSRTISAGEIFFAIKGDNFDGHSFVDDAIAAGARLAVVANQFQSGVSDMPLLRVGDPLEAMRALAAAARVRSSARIIAVTGSVGKTGTKDGLTVCLRDSGLTHASPASFNNHWGVPFTLANLPVRAAYGIFEIGMNHAGEITPLTLLVRPHIAIVTTIALVHIGYLGSIEAIADAKAEIFEGLETGGFAVLNRDNEQFERLEAAARSVGGNIITFGTDDKADARLLYVEESAIGIHIEADILGQRTSYYVPEPGRHLAMNSLAILAAARLANVELDVAARALANWHSAKGRGTQITLYADRGPFLLIDESYNANPVSVRAALGVLGYAGMGNASDCRSGGRRVAVLGDMLELGELAQDAHGALADIIEKENIDRVYCCGRWMKFLFDRLRPSRRGGYFEDAHSLAQILCEEVGPGDAIMVKGSFAIGMGGVVEALKQRFSLTQKPGG
jgi:UDP-N-acetylmuramoyl-tripeptide--D-alanyl-D-alanine ligase